jgi:hypothetical protein
VAPDGCVSVRWDRSADVSTQVGAVFVSSFLIVLREGRRSLEVWCDAAPAEEFRRLAVALRWRTTRDKSVVGSSDRPHAADRT